MSKKTDNSQYKIPHYDQFASESSYTYVEEKTEIKGNNTPKKEPIIRHTQSIPKVAPTNIYEDMLNKASEIVKLRAKAEEEIKEYQEKFSWKYLRKKPDFLAVNGPLHYKNLALKPKNKRRDISRELLDLESSLGATIFGTIPHNVRREFFALDHDSWIWHEEWTDSRRKKHQNTTRYEVKNNTVIKVQVGPHYFELKGQELDNFYKAVTVYHQNILRFIYGIY